MKRLMNCWPHTYTFYVQYNTKVVTHDHDTPTIHTDCTLLVLAYYLDSLPLVYLPLQSQHDMCGLQYQTLMHLLHLYGVHKTCICILQNVAIYSNYCAPYKRYYARWHYSVTHKALTSTIHTSTHVSTCTKTLNDSTTRQVLRTKILEFGFKNVG